MLERGSGGDQAPGGSEQQVDSRERGRGEPWAPWTGGGFLRAVGLGGVGALLTACQQRGSSAGSAPAPSPSTAGDGAPAAAEWERRWSELVDAAKREGSVVVAGPPTPDTRTEFTAAFRDRFGISLEYLGGRTGELMTRLKAERAAGVLHGGRHSRGRPEPLPGGLSGADVRSARPRLDPPGGHRPAKWVVGRVLFMDPEQQYMLRLTNFLTLLVSVNTQYVRAEEIRSWADLLDPRYRGKISADDPNVAGSGWNTASYLLGSLGEDYVRRALPGPAAGNQP